jgi:hypothetical protein
MHLNKAYSKVSIDKNVPDAFPIQNSLNRGDALLPLLFNFESSRKQGMIGIEWNTPALGQC